MIHFRDRCQLRRDATWLQKSDVTDLTFPDNVARNFRVETIYLSNLFLLNIRYLQVLDTGHYGQFVMFVDLRFFRTSSALSLQTDCWRTTSKKIAGNWQIHTEKYGTFQSFLFSILKNPAHYVHYIIDENIFVHLCQISSDIEWIDVSEQESFTIQSSEKKTLETIEYYGVISFCFRRQLYSIIMYVIRERNLSF